MTMHQLMFTRWCEKEIFTPTMRRAAHLMERAADLHLIQVYRRLDLATRLAQPKTPRQLADELAFVPSAGITLDAMLWRLASRTPHVRLAGPESDPRYVAASDPEDPSAELLLVWAEIQQLGPGFDAAREFIEFGATRFEEALRDDPDLMDRMLSGREPRFQDLWHRATNADPLQDVHGVLGAKAVCTLFKTGTILEIGGGTGNGIRHLFDLMARKKVLNRIDRYIFTDISQSFVLDTKHEIQQDYPEVATSWRFMDINRPFGKQKFGKESVDLIYGVNAAHVARDIRSFLRECHDALKPGGKVIFSERIRNHPRSMAPREVTLNLSVYHRTAAQSDQDWRGSHCYLTAEKWTEALHAAGFSTTLICPDLNRMRKRFPECYAGVVIAER